MTNIVNGAPQIILLGTKDVSTREPLRSVQSRPTHLPLSYFYARRGPAGARLIGDGDQTQYTSTRSIHARSTTTTLPCSWPVSWAKAMPSWQSA